MPRVRRTPKPGLEQPTKAPAALLRSCLDVLLQGGDPSCLGGTELACGCCALEGASPDVVDSLCAFCLHSEASRQFFVSVGGLDALLLAGQSVVEGTVSSALQVLQCLSVSSSTQELLLSIKPQLLLLVTQLAAAGQDSPAAEDREGLQHAALCLLTSWVQDSGSPFAAWALQHRVRRRPGSSEGSGGAGWGGSALHTPEADAENHGALEHKGSLEPLLVCISAQALTHPSLPLRKAAARLFVSVAAAGASLSATQSPASQGSMLLHGGKQHTSQWTCFPALGSTNQTLVSECARAAMQLAQQLNGVLSPQPAPSPSPRFQAYAAQGQPTPDLAALQVSACICAHMHVIPAAV
ncbi:hypothetical protein DUNSADRAFT_13183 [Dunaliella salina]|uniref:Uncharacterized protein n=1 Tax=Dunaliella salina TaxID=3046 RepID=A0ABQ7G9W8_DUNSA|nr:hypothetical protein DUNSADRAFT_13183 [Dunaliella salina]|eukprot:KAF5831393.1 hypothetical protein DUNSADRAFT_13183 [Dunaliella salina]